MEQNVKSTDLPVAEDPNTAPAGSFETKVGRTTYVIGIHFAEKTKDTVDKKIKRLICEEVKNESFS